MSSYALAPVGFIGSTLKTREEAPRQGAEGAPDAWLEIEPRFADALLGMEVRPGESVLRRIGHELIVITWMHQAICDMLKNHPRGDESRPLTRQCPVPLGLFTRSPASTPYKACGCRTRMLKAFEFLLTSKKIELGQLHPVTVREIDGNA